MNNLESLIRLMARHAVAYFGSPIGNYFAIRTNRLMLYPFMSVVFLLECLVYWVIRHGPAFLLEHIAFSTIYSLHKAALFTICLLSTDVLANRLSPNWGAYMNRTVGRQWIIWALGLIIGVILLKNLVNRFIVHYAPEVIHYFIANPAARPNLFKILIILLPVWGMAVFLTLRLATSKTQMKRLAGEIVVVPEESLQSNLSPPVQEDKHPVGTLRTGPNNGNGIITLANITHITVEDHYCRVHYSTGNGLKNVMIRLPLKEMMQKLPQEYFFQTHRSHVVNLGYISYLARKGREHKVVLSHFGVELPVSRHRFKQLEPRLKTTSGSNSAVL